MRLEVGASSVWNTFGSRNVVKLSDEQPEHVGSCLQIMQANIIMLRRRCGPDHCESGDEQSKHHHPSAEQKQSIHVLHTDLRELRLLRELFSRTGPAREEPTGEHFGELLPQRIFQHSPVEDGSKVLWQPIVFRVSETSGNRREVERAHVAEVAAAVVIEEVLVDDVRGSENRTGASFAHRAGAVLHRVEAPEGHVGRGQEVLARHLLRSSLVRRAQHTHLRGEYFTPRGRPSEHELRACEDRCELRGVGCDEHQREEQHGYARELLGGRAADDGAALQKESPRVVDAVEHAAPRALA
mmetsp:Transcript_14540/g.34623  ORF Transcript_14540/g.34623 Transcript_14540/m.34623 type:complete len:298 (+) Transcript_14540:231-1124(+)